MFSVRYAHRLNALRIKRTMRCAPSKLIFVVSLALFQRGLTYANQPLAEAPARTDGQSTVFTASGKLEAVWPGGFQIAFFSNKPFWGPPHYGWDRLALWPADTLLILLVGAPTPVTIDGRKVKASDLKAGEEVIVQYQVGLGIGGAMGCSARRIDARSVSPSKKQPEAPRKHY